jgi:hypothetical protein
MTEITMEKDVAELKRQVEFLTQKLDECRRALRLSPLLDAQLLHINSRTGDRLPAA